MHGSPLRTLLSRPALGPACLVAVLLAGPGCTRQFYRKRADDDVTGVITQKNVFPDWAVKNWHVYPDPRARFADPARPDRPPYPPDDYAARVLSPNPQRPTKKVGAGRFEGTGYADYLSRWDAENRAADALDVENPPVQPPPAERLPAPKLLPPKPAAPAALRKPTVTEVREAGVVVAAGEFTEGGRTVPIVALIPAIEPPGLGVQPAGGQPAPAAPGAGAQPGAVGPIGPDGPGGPMAMVATGDAALDILSALSTNETGYRIKMEQAVELGLFNSREFQDRREDLYLAALPVTLARFSFAAQGFFTEAAALNYAGRLAGRVPQDSATFGTTAGVGKLFPTGAQLAVKLANQVVVDLSNGQPTTAVSNLSLGLSQPFLRGGGYAVTLEPLTFAERNMVYAMRSYARFRKLFYVAVAAGGNITNNPYSFQGLAQNLGRGVGGNLTAPSVGYLPLLLQSAQIANQRRNVQSLEQLLRLYQAFREGGQQSDLQVMQVEQQLIGGRTTLLGQSGVTAAGGGGANQGSGIRGFLDAVDNFKLQLGLPLTTGLDFDAAPLRPVRDQLARFEAVYAQVRDIEALARRYDPAEPVAQFRARWRQLLTDAPLVRGTAFARDIVNRWAAWERLTPDQLARRFTDLAEERRKLLDRRADRLLRGQPEPADETRRADELEAELELGAFERAVRGYEARPWAKEPTPGAQATAQAAAFRDVFNAFFQLILAARNDRLADIRRQWPKLPPVVVDGVDLLDVPLDDAYTAGIQTALTQRLDLMNSRGLVVDAWRQIKVQANSLQGVLTVGYNLGSSTPTGGANPVAFSGDRTTQNLTFNAELPLVRRAERNNYRAALITYQRQRRTLQAFEDNIANDVRSDVREVRTIAQLYRTQQRLVELGYAQVDNAQAVLLAPPAPGALADAGSAAALTNQVLQAQQSLVTAQNQLYTVWVNYLVSRMTLYLDLELMQLDDRGGWCNEPLPSDQEPARPVPAGERLPAPRAVPSPARQP